MKRLIPIVMFVVLSAGGHCFAESETSQVFGRDLGVEIGFEASHFTYKEPGLMQEKGFMYGLTGALAWRNYNYMVGL